MQNITFDDFKKLDLKVGEIKTAERVEGSDKLIRLEVDTGDEELRQLVAGIGKSYEPDDLPGKLIVVLVNLKPKSLMGLESQGMLLAVATEDGVSILSPDKDVSPGSKIS